MFVSKIVQDKGTIIIRNYNNLNNNSSLKFEYMATRP